MIPSPDLRIEEGTAMMDASQREEGGARQRRDVSDENAQSVSQSDKVSGGGGQGSGRKRATEDTVWFVIQMVSTAWLFGYSAWKCVGWREQIALGNMNVGGLHRGWLWNLPLDLSDHQWRTLRGFFPLLSVDMAVHSLVSAGARRLTPRFPGARVLPRMP